MLCWIRLKGFLGVIFGTDYHGMHAFCIFSINNTFWMGMVKLKQEEEPWGHHVCVHCVTSLFFLIFVNISAKANSRRVDIYHMHVNMHVICWNYLKFSCNLMLFSELEVTKMRFWLEKIEIAGRFY